MDASNVRLFSPYKIRSVEFKNRFVCSPMCMYSAEDGVPNDWHMVHLGSRAVGGVGLVIVEATSVSPEGRITENDLGIWNDQQSKAFEPIVQFIKKQNCVPGIQLAHAGRKSSIPGNVAPSAVPFAASEKPPRALNEEDLAKITADFVRATERALAAGFQVLEIHMAHGYLLHEFLSPISNHRDDQYGGSLENRMRFPLAVAKAVRAAWPAEFPLFVRISATDWVPAGWDLEESIQLSIQLKSLGIDLIDCSTGGTAPDAVIPVGKGYQVPFASAIREQAKIATGAVGIIVTGTQAEQILQDGHADLIFVARELLRDPYFPLHAAKELGVDLQWPKQYERAKR